MPEIRAGTLVFGIPAHQLPGARATFKRPRRQGITPHERGLAGTELRLDQGGPHEHHRRTRRT
eukprot:4863085-Pleurochrysis_carterae.AAC.1